MAEQLKAGNFPFGQFISYLQSENFEIGIDTYLHLSKIFLSIDHDADVISVRNIIGALVCKSQEQQERYLQLFESFKKAVTGKSDGPVIIDPNKQLKSKLKNSALKIIGAAAAIVLILLLCGYYYYTNTNKETPSNPVESTKNEEDTTTTTTQPKLVAATDSIQQTITPVALVKFKLPQVNPDLSGNIIEETLLQKYYPYIRIAWLPVIAFLSLVYVFIVFYRKRLIIKYQEQKTPPYIWRMEIDEQAQIKMSDAYAVASGRLRRRVQTDNFSINYYQTVMSTIKKLGFLDIRYRQRSALPEYLVLIDKAGDNNLYSDFLSYMVKRFTRDDIHMTWYYYRNDPNVCWNESKPQGLLIHQLLSIYANSQLILIGDGNRLIHPLKPELTETGSILLNWKYRAILTPRPLSNWAAEEYILSDNFVLLPANDFGWTEVVTCFETEKKFDPWDLKYGYDQPKDTIIFTETPEIDFANIKQLLKTQGYPDAILDWLCGCCIYPELNWSLTLYIGKCLSEEQKILTQENLDWLASLPWFRSGRIPEKHRVYFLSKLATAKRKKIVSGILELLKKHAPEKTKYQNTYAYDDYALKLVITELLMEEGGSKERELLTKLKDLEQFTEPRYYGVLSALDDLKTNPFDFILPRSFRKYFYRDKFPYFKPRQYVKLASVGLFATVPFIFGPPEVCTGIHEVYAGKEYCLVTENDFTNFNRLKDQNDDFIFTSDTSQESRITQQYNAGVMGYEAGDYDSALFTFLSNDRVTVHNAKMDSLEYYQKIGVAMSRLFVLNKTLNSREIIQIAFENSIGFFQSITKQYPQYSATNELYKANVLALAKNFTDFVDITSLEKKIGPIALDNDTTSNEPVFISGIVVNEDQVPIADVSVSVTGETQKIVTDERGAFRIPVNNTNEGRARLHFTVSPETGFTSRDLLVTVGPSPLKVILSSNLSNLKISIVQQERGLLLKRFDLNQYGMSTIIYAAIIDPSLYSPDIVGMTKEKPNGVVPDVIAQMSKPKVLLGSGFVESFSPLVPNGFLKVNNEVVNAVKREGYNAIVGVHDNKLSLQPSTSSVIDLRGGFQTGPALVREGRNVYNMQLPTANDRYNRAFIAVNTSGQVVAAITEGKVSLKALSTFLSDTDIKDLRCVTAFNLSGGGSEMLIVQNDKGEINRYGSYDAYHSALIAFFPPGDRQEKIQLVDLNSYETNNNIGFDYLMQLDIDKALYHFLKADSIRPGSNLILMNMGEAYRYKKDFAKSLSLHSQVLNRLKPKGSILNKYTDWPLDKKYTDWDLDKWGGNFMPLFKGDRETIKKSVPLESFEEKKAMALFAIALDNVFLERFNEADSALSKSLDLIRRNTRYQQIISLFHNRISSSKLIAVNWVGGNNREVNQKLSDMINKMEVEMKRAESIK